MTTYCQFHDTEAAAIEQCRRINRQAGRWITVVIDGPSDDWAVVDPDTAIDMDAPYRVF